MDKRVFLASPPVEKEKDGAVPSPEKFVEGSSPAAEEKEDLPLSPDKEEKASEDKGSSSYRGYEPPKKGDKDG